MDKTYIQPYSGIVFTIGEAPLQYNFLLTKRVDSDGYITITVIDHKRGIKIWETLCPYDEYYEDYEPCNIAASLLHRFGIILERPVKWELYGLKSDTTIFIS